MIIYFYNNLVEGKSTNMKEFPILRILGKAIIYTLITILMILILFTFFNNNTSNISAQQADILLIVCFLVGIIFTIYVCTLFIISSLKNK